MFYAVKNLTEQAVLPSEPQTFTPAENITPEIRTNRLARQAWYSNPNTRHLFYTGMEAVNAAQRVSKQNPVHAIHSLTADFDLPIPTERWKEAVAQMRVKPQWAERSVGGNLRLIWCLEKPLIVSGNSDFAAYLLIEARNFLVLDLLPGLDAPAFLDAARLYCRGDSWERVSPEPVPALEVQSLFVKAGKAFAFKGASDTENVPLDVVERALTARYPNFSWPGSFELESAGPSFWIPESVSPRSAIIKPGGFFSFSAHAQKIFTPWSDLLGLDFAAQWTSEAIAKATHEVFFDGHEYWRYLESEGRYVNSSKDALSIFFRVNCRVSDKRDKGGISPLDRCLAHVHDYARVAGAGPVLFQPIGKLRCCGQWIVNTAPKSSVVQPNGAADPKFPFLDSLFSTLFDPADQKWPFLAWLKHLYLGALQRNPGPGQSLFLAGGVGIGKTLLNRHIIGELVGGHADASQFLLGNSPFNSHLFESPIWSVDDSTPADSDAAHRTFSSCIKAITANQTFTYNKKFQVNFMISWSGRIVVTLNLTETSSRALIAMDDSVADKVSLFKCATKPTVVFPERATLRDIIKSELPHLAQWLVSWQVPAELLGDTRYGVRAWHEPSLLDKARQASRSAPFSELIIDFLTRHFADNPKATDWAGSVTQVMRAISEDPMNEHSVRSLRLDQVNRHLEALAKDGGIECVSEVGKHKIRIWRFARL